MLNNVFKFIRLHSYDIIPRTTCVQTPHSSRGGMFHTIQWGKKTFLRIEKVMFCTRCLSSLENENNANDGFR